MCAKHGVPIDDQRPAMSFWADIIEGHSTPGDVVLVPFAQGAAIARAALGQGRRAILLVRTPAQQLRLWGSLVPVTREDQQRALARLAATAKRDTPLDLYIQDLYRTICPNCAQPTPALAFIWDMARGVPVARDLACAACGFHGRALAHDSDVRAADRFERRGLSFWFIMEWLVDAQDASGREIARRYLDAYSPRNLTALADITRKIDAELGHDPASQRLLRLWLLHALDAGRLEPDPVDETRLVERNVWHLLAHPSLTDDIDPPVRLTTDLAAFFHAPEPTPNIALAAGPLRKLARQLPPKSVALILGEPPNLDMELWIWEQLWSRWVFGRAGAGGLQPPIGGWERHVRALGAALRDLVPTLRPDGRAVFRFQDDDPHRAGALLAAMAPHATLDGFVYQPTLIEPARLFATAGGTYHLAFTSAPPTAPSLVPGAAALAERVEDVAVTAASDVIRTRAEPLHFGWLLAAGLVHLARSGLLRQAMSILDTEISPLAFARQHMRQGLRTALAEGHLVAVAGDRPTHWWLPEPPQIEPLAERVEQAVIDLLKRESAVTLAEVYARFPGWLTPEAELVEALLAAYGEPIDPHRWRLRSPDPAEQPAIRDALYHLGARLGFTVSAGIADVVWEEAGHTTYAFRIVRTGSWHNLGIATLPEGMAGYLVLPDRLVDLLRVKLVRNPLWRRELAEQRWTPVKARHLLTMAGETEVDRQAFKKIVGLDPIIEQAKAQMPLF